MSMLYNLSIRNKLIGITLFVTILALGIGFTLVIVSNIKSFKENTNKNAGHPPLTNYTVLNLGG